jgi:hypothetical protein
MDLSALVKTMVEFPPRQSPGSWTPEQMMEKLKKNAAALKAAAIRVKVSDSIRLTESCRCRLARQGR